MKKIIFILFLITFLDCKVLELKGYKNLSSITRCENKEVVCYILEGVKRGGISCKFKGVK